MDARMATMATTIINSIKVKPRALLKCVEFIMAPNF
jgi:hypothetical protein